MVPVPARAPARILACMFPTATAGSQCFDASSSVRELAAGGVQAGGPQVRVLENPTFPEFQTAVRDLAPGLVYLAGRTAFDGPDADAGAIGPLTFKDGSIAADALASSCKGIEAVYLDVTPSSAQQDVGAQLQSAGVQHVIAWQGGGPVPAVQAAHFAHAFFAALLAQHAAVHEAHAVASHAVRALALSAAPPPAPAPLLPALLSATAPQLPDNASIAPPDIPGVEPGVGLAAVVPGWSDIRLLAPRAELRLLLAGEAGLIDAARLSFLGEALRALLVLETRDLKVVKTTPCRRTPANLPAGCTALRCEARTGSGAEVVAVLGGQPPVLADDHLVEHALRMTLVADSLSLQFRLPPPGAPAPVPRRSVAVAGGAPTVEALVLTSVWAVRVLRGLGQTPGYKPLIALGVASVGGTAVCAVSPVDAQRLKMLSSGQGPHVHPLAGASAPPSHLPPHPDQPSAEILSRDEPPPDPQPGV